MTEYFIGLTLPPAEEKKIAAWRERFYPGSGKRHPPHLTIIPPFEWPEAQTDLADLDKLAATLPKTNLTFQGVGPIAGNEKIFCIRLQKTAELEKLRQKLLRLTHAETKPGFEPHLSLAKEKSGNFRGLQEYFQSIDLNYTLPAADLVIFRGQRGSTWQKWRVYHLPSI